MASGVYTKSMAVTHKDFFRILPNAMGPYPYTLNGFTAIAQVGSGEVKITIGPEQVRQIALMRIDYCDVEFSYDKLPQKDYDEFQRHFELRYQRGGG